MIIGPKTTGPELDDTGIAGFLNLLERDLASRPEALMPLSKELIARGETLIEGMDVDLDAPLIED